MIEPSAWKGWSPLKAEDTLSVTFGFKQEAVYTRIFVPNGHQHADQGVRYITLKGLRESKTEKAFFLVR